MRQDGQIERFSNTTNWVLPVVGAAAGSAIGRIGGAALAVALFEAPVEPTTMHRLKVALVEAFGAAAVGAAVAALAAPPEVRTRAAIGAALSGVVPMPEMFGKFGEALAGSATAGIFTYMAVN